MRANFEMRVHDIGLSHMPGPSGWQSNYCQRDHYAPLAVSRL
jgi:hypothetical protein